MASKNVFPNTFLDWKDCIHLTQFYSLSEKQRKPYVQFYPMEDIARKRLPIFFMAFKEQQKQAESLLKKYSNSHRLGVVGYFQLATIRCWNIFNHESLWYYLYPNQAFLKHHTGSHDLDSFKFYHSPLQLVAWVHSNTSAWMNRNQ